MSFIETYKDFNPLLTYIKAIKTFYYSQYSRKNQQFMNRTKTNW